MKLLQKTTVAKVLVTLTALSVLVAVTPSANAATKTITCYKGTVVKKVTAAKPKCPAGYTTTKPVVKPAVPAKGGVVAFSGTYSGKIALLWGDSYVQATSVEGTGTGNVLGLTDLSGIGSAAPANQCDTFNGSGTLGGGGNTLKVTFDSSAQACAADSDAPTSITFTGNAVINGGTGKYVGASGTLKVTAGAFNIQSSSAGKKESDAFKFTISGNIITK
ncbi:unannotated protein [freshwater metagenome]|uniref:Unannotated protein n=1 Tax=freshwater metagenome TaxID=449393 RepID=A0A6J7W5G5_9ZZZZ|nr:hypothetical protein [Actinomycetota bacterium]MSX89986.1 hypothetical protein [Actinomycetota bacterium]MSZ63889.1 hypothetical protein [Actinomycetota bacterium]MTA57591.1 hypothetical protein [Actinomycetota bacterium]